MINKYASYSKRKLLSEYFTDLDAISLDSDGNIPAIDDSGPTKPVYIVLTYTGTTFAKLVHYFTGDSYTHVAIAFDKSLKEIYSTDWKANSFLIESIEQCIELASNKVFSVYQVNVSLPVYDKLYNIIQDLKNGIRHIYYNKLGILGIILNTPIMRQDAYFCSEFVANIFKQANQPLFTRKPLSLVRPYDYAKNKKLRLFYKGTLQRYKYYQPEEA